MIGSPVVGGGVLGPSAVGGVVGETDAVPPPDPPPQATRMVSENAIRVRRSRLTGCDKTPASPVLRGSVGGGG